MRSLLAGRFARQAAFVLICAAVSATGCAFEARGQAAAQRGAAAAGTDGEAGAPLTNAAVVKLVRAKFSEKTVIAIIRTRPARFDLSPDRLIELKKNGVGERIILTMLARAEGDMISARDDEGDAFDDDPFFEGMRGRTRAPEAGKPADGQGGDPNEVNIFGSSGGVRGRTRSRVGGGAAEGDMQTNGSASVRILRPPSEAGAASGGAEPKLERTPTLTNDSVIELVEAGFSEGTIIRRIEGSPVEFDFTPAKVAELRRRRVGAAVIAAMRAASGEEGAGVR
ncbi:MAG TPA: hypothetical protein VF703_10520 [Pyrinomonadaceae bacterium]|jgi:hypothetical protein